MSYVFVGWLIACGGEPTVAPSVPEPAPPEAAVPVEDAEAARAKEAQAAIQALGKDLKGRLIEQMQQGGPAAAVDVCGKEAQARTQRIAETTGIQVGRASSRLRNPKNQGPAWVQEWLQARGDQGVNFHPGVWHHPLLVLQQQDFLVIDRGGAGDNLVEQSLETSVSITAGSPVA